MDFPDKPSPTHLMDLISVDGPMLDKQPQERRETHTKPQSDTDKSYLTNTQMDMLGSAMKVSYCYHLQQRNILLVNTLLKTDIH